LLNPLQRERNKHHAALYPNDLWGAKSRYWKWLYDKNKALWMILDPVVSVHPDGVISRCFRATNRVMGASRFRPRTCKPWATPYSAPLMSITRSAWPTRCGACAITVPAFLGVGGEGVSLSTSAGNQFEKKIDLPTVWVRGFLQVQSASSLPATNLTLSSSTIAEILFAMHQNREAGGPRSLRFQLVNGQKPTVIVEPWNIEIREHEYSYEGRIAGNSRVGTPPLFALENLLPHAPKSKSSCSVAGMPSYWSVEQQGHRFD
jgi:hypothetical protein